MNQIAMLPGRGRADPAPGENGFAQAVRAGLAARPRSIPARYFYDTAGSQLFEAITALPEYYPTRVETVLLAAHAAEVAQAVGPGRAVVEFGSGSSAKTPLLLGAVSPSAYVPIDISGEFLHQSAASLAAAHPGLCVLPVAGDFTQRITLPAALHGRRLLGFFPGSTVGNFSHAQAVDLLRAFRATLGVQSWLLIGIDTRKDPAILHAAYDDPQGITAAFNLNLLHRINRELRGTIPIEAFVHEIRWNTELGRIEMHLRAKADVAFTAAGVQHAMAAGETLHTENSYKYTEAEARLLAHAAGFTPHAAWTDPDGLFALHLWQAAAERLEP